MQHPGAPSKFRCRNFFKRSRAAAAVWSWSVPRNHPELRHSPQPCVHCCNSAYWWRQLRGQRLKLQMAGSGQPVRIGCQPAPRTVSALDVYWLRQQMLYLFPNIMPATGLLMNAQNRNGEPDVMWSTIQKLPRTSMTLLTYTEDRLDCASMRFKLALCKCAGQKLHQRMYVRLQMEMMHGLCITAPADLDSSAPQVRNPACSAHLPPPGMRTCALQTVLWVESHSHMHSDVV